MDSNHRDIRFCVRLSTTEFEQLKRLTRKSTCRTPSDYARNVLLNRPVTRREHNETLAEFLLHMGQLNAGLNKANNAMTEAVRRLHDVRGAAEIQQWILHNEQDKTRLFKEIQAIRDLVNKSYKLWSQE